MTEITEKKQVVLGFSCMREALAWGLLGGQFVTSMLSFYSEEADKS